MQKKKIKSDDNWKEWDFRQRNLLFMYEQIIHIRSNNCLFKYGDGRNTNEKTNIRDISFCMTGL